MQVPGTKLLGKTKMRISKLLSPDMKGFLKVLWFKGVSSDTMYKRFNPEIYK